MIALLLALAIGVGGCVTLTPPALDDWLKRRALDNERTHASRTYAVTAGGRVVGYYALANGAVASVAAPGRVRRNMPDPIPVMIIGRLAVDVAFQGHGVGQGLLRDAVLRTIQATEIAGIRAVVVHALSEDAKKFYMRHGFQESPVSPLTLMITLADAHAAHRSDPNIRALTVCRVLSRRRSR